MASDANFPYITTVALIFLLLMLLHTTMGYKEDTLPKLTTTDGVMKRKNLGFTRTRRLGIGHGKIDSKKNVIHIPPPSRRREWFRSPRSPLPWKDGIFNASAHEVPSGPNPISNR
ncbi:hypothetical protein CFOL_v3_18539 [Cephalotus follicularis]|uniref:Transmembrane protein n=1 Tax=Cephalotus follicularis TaxID=3775 RepID=A0A1Q3C4A5_CEPFO|nr:hypothetical protein CFOL_v3_18539 [Cephalotus follicularis]